MFATSGAFVKLAADLGATLPQTILMRSLPAVILILAWARLTRRNVLPDDWKSHLGRNVAGGMAMWLSFYAMAHLPLSIAFSLNYTAPLFLAGWMILQGRAKTNIWQLIAVLLGFLGVVIVLQPTLEWEQWFPCVVGLLSGAFAAIAWLQLRRLGRAKEPEWRTVLIFSAFTSVTSVVALSVDGWQRLDLLAWSCLLTVGLLGMVGQFAMTRAYGSGSTLLAAALHYSTVIFATLLGILLWGDLLSPLAWTGIGLIVCSGTLAGIQTRRRDLETLVGRTARVVKP
jgi:S-adenosylmethionine uptake transporter